MTLVARILQRPQTLLLRRLLFQVHLWVGIGAGLYIFIVGLTGVAMVFREEMEQRANPGLYPAREGTPASIAAVVDNIRSAYPDHRVTGVYSPTTGRPVYYAFIERNGRFSTALTSVDGRVLGIRPETGVIRWLQELHVNLLAGRRGRIVNGVGAGLLLMLCLTGPMIWWPGVATWKRGVRVDFRKPWRRVFWELHNAVGIWTVLVVAMWAVTGIYFAFPQPFQRVMGRLSPLKPPAAYLSDPSRAPERFDLGTVVAAARGAVPGGQVAGVVLPTTERGTVLVQVSRFEPNHLDNTGYVHFTFDQYSGALLGKWDQFDRSTGDAVLSWMLPLHFGSFGGIVVKVLWVVGGLGPPTLFATGAVMWWNRVLRKRSNAGGSAREAPRPPGQELPGLPRPTRRDAS